MITNTFKRPRPLTHDELKAAEAAFQGQPFNVDWSQSARAIYDGLAAALRKRQDDQPAFPLLEYRPARDWEGSLDECMVSQEGD
ncbi:MAG: hypothetical protein FJ245_03055 [Nitrospira sp.]|nr:hypothetical protein [Nitrospira sp.]